MLLEMLEPNLSMFLTTLSLSLGVVAFICERKYRRLLQDVECLGESVRSLIRSGSVTPRTVFLIPQMTVLWRKILSFYAGVSRFSKIKGEAEVVLSSAIDLLDRTDSGAHVLEVLSDVILKTSGPESRFVSVAQYQKLNRCWTVSAASGISKARVEDAFLLALEALPIEDGRTFIYANSQNGAQFNFSGLGVGLSLFAPIYQLSEVVGMVWIAFGEQVSGISESRRETLELIIKHALVSYLSSMRSEEKNKKLTDHKDKILALSHDLKSPSVRALYALRELKNELENLNEDRTLLVNEVEFALEEQLGLIGELFSVDTNGGSGNGLKEEQGIEIASMLRSRVDAFKLVARSVNLELHVGSLQRARVLIPKDVLNRILDNLLSNAIKYTASGFVKVSTLALGNRIEVRVEDSGTGVKPELVPFLFTSKMREQSRQDNSGQGFGLSVVRKLLEDWNGSISYFEKEDGGGAVFAFSLPVLSFLENSRRQSKTGYVLLIDDDNVVRNVHARWLQGSVERIRLASSFSEALEIIQLEKPALIITDVNIPGESFYDFISLLSRDNAIIILTAERRESLLNSISVDFPFLEVIEKPIERKGLINAVTKGISYLNSLEGYEKAA